MHKSEIENNRAAFGKDNVDSYGNIIYPVDVTDRGYYCKYLKAKEEEDRILADKIFTSEFGQKIDVTLRSVFQGRGLGGLKKEEKMEVYDYKLISTSLAYTSISYLLDF